MPLLKSLNKEQKEAVLHTDGPLLIIAGAGSGKTMALTHRIAYLIKNKNISPFGILAVTFTNKAAEEMKNRLEKLTGASAKNIWIGTFHSICGRILRADINKLGRDNNFVIFDSDDQKSLMKQVLKELNLDIKQYRPNAILDSISRAKNELINEREYAGKASDLWEEKVAQCYKLYQEKLLKNNALDFDDMLMQAVLLLKQSPQTAKKYQDRFQYVHVDEYQDTNHAQYMLANILSFKHKNICVVGDDDQSIYAFRGADIKNILEFERDYPNAQVIKLEENYRSTQNILNAANFVVANNFMRKNKKLWTKNTTGEKIVHYEANDEKDEAAFIAKKIIELKKEIDLRQIAVLYRTNAQSRAIEEMLIKRGIAYKIVGGYRFFERKEIKDIVALMRLIYNPHDDLSCTRVIGFLADGIGKTTLSKLDQQSKANKSSVLEAIKNINKELYSPKTRNSLVKFYEQIEYFRNSISDLSASEIVKKILAETDYLKNIEEEKTEESVSRSENIREFLSVAIDFEEKSDDKSLESFLLFMSLITDQETSDKSDSFVTLITLHAVKGLEFPVVFIAGMEEGLFPHFRSMMDPASLEEERRLCYVGLTRAKKKLFVLSAIKRMIFGEERWGSISRFISEIPSDLLIQETLHDSSNQELINTKMNYDGMYSLGDIINHPKWGEGEIIKIEGENTDIVMDIAFEKSGTKTLMLKYAPIQKACI